VYAKASLLMPITLQYQKLVKFKETIVMRSLLIIHSLCLHFQASKNSILPRPLGTAYHANKPNQVIHFDYLFISKADAKTHNGYNNIFSFDG
jgi:hypothetical protein